jgi:hypothetical protein
MGVTGLVVRFGKDHQMTSDGTGRDIKSKALAQLVLQNRLLQGGVVLK